MQLSAHTIQSTQGTRTTVKRVGRGNGSGRGTYSSRGMKGQRARSGGKSGRQRLGFKQSLQKIPKLRGFNSITPKLEIITLKTLENITKDGDVITPTFLKNRGVISRPVNGVKIIGSGEMTKKLTVKHCLATKQALAAIEKAGGSIIF